MVAKSVKRALSLSLLLPSVSLALGLGDIRLLSSLNAPLDAEIELIGATPDELASLKAAIASRDTFARYGLEAPAYLNTVTLTPAKSSDGRDVIKLRSTETITEPFVTMLVQVEFSRGKLVREYTMLLDPPVFTPGSEQVAAAPIAAPATAVDSRAGEIARTPVEPEPALPPPPAETVAQEQPLTPEADPGLPPLEPEQPRSGSADVQSLTPLIDSSTHQVRKGETLSGLADRFSTPTDINRWMVSTYQGNPGAFDGSMNILRAGAVLRLPDQTTVTSIAPDEATAEVRRQYASYRSSAGSSISGSVDSDRGQLRLVAAPATTGSGQGGANPDVDRLRNRVVELESQLDESRRLLKLKNDELARMQERLSTERSARAEPPAPPAPAAEDPQPASTASASEEQLSPEVTPDPALVAESADTPPPEEEAPQQAASAEQPEPGGGSIVDKLLSNWWIFGGVGALALAFFGFRSWRSRRSTAEFDDSIGRLATAGAESLSRDEPMIPSFDDAPPPRSARRDRERDDFLADEGAQEQPRFDGAATVAPAARNVSADDTISSETAINLDQGDPLAEADFHMAYGLYDQAADLVRIAINREPARRDLKLKLLEVYFVWGNKEQFLQAARELAESRAQAAPGEWEKIVIMGKQLAPDDPLFAGGAGISGAAASGVDLDLEGGQSRVDFDLMGESGGDTGLDLDIGTALGESEAAMGSGRSTDRNLAMDDDMLSAEAGGSTRQMTQRMSGYSEPMDTVEQPGLYGQQSTIRQKVETAMRQGGTESTAELAIDDLGLDLGGLDNLDSSSPDAPTMVAGMDERSRRMIETAEQRVGNGTNGTGSWRYDGSLGDEDDQRGYGMRANGDGSSTSRLAALKGGNGGLDFDIGELDANGANGADVDLDVGTDTETVSDAAFTSTQRLQSSDLALPDLEPVTMSEVGTKLDLARAYMDMGDPEGARNILEEVMQEGSMAQKQEAQRLMEALPG